MPVAHGYEDLRDEDGLIEALEGLQRHRPGLARAILKVDSSYWDDGNAVVRLPAGGPASRD